MSLNRNKKPSRKNLMQLSGLILLLLTSCVLMNGCIHGIFPNPPGDNNPPGKDTFAVVTGKRLIEYGWDVPTPAYLSEHIDEMQDRPFEGITFQMPDFVGQRIFQVHKWETDKDKLEGQADIISSIKWGRFSDNFLLMNSYTESKMDWFSDSTWEKIIAKTKILAHIAKEGNCVGVLFDPESPGPNGPWSYKRQEHAQTKSLEEYSVKVRQRGEEFMEALQSEIPQVKVLGLIQYWVFHFMRNDRADSLDNVQGFPHFAYGLYLPFLNGMLAAANPGSELINGNENAYYYQQPSTFRKIAQETLGVSRENVRPSSLQSKYGQIVKMGNALYVDWIYNLHPDIFPNAMGTKLTQEERNKWFEQNVYHSLKTSSKYVWLYSENMDWWENENIPEGIIDAIRSAKRKLAKGQELGFDLAPVFERAGGYNVPGTPPGSGAVDWW